MLILTTELTQISFTAYLLQNEKPGSPRSKPNESPTISITPTAAIRHRSSSPKPLSAATIGGRSPEAGAPGKTVDTCMNNPKYKVLRSLRFASRT